MPILCHRTPCKACPFLRSSAAGWLGGTPAEDFINAVQLEGDMPCHQAIDYCRDDWEHQIITAPRCAGSLVFLKNTCQIPVGVDLAAARDRVAVDRARVFARRSEFLEHHRRKPDGTPTENPEASLLSRMRRRYSGD